MFLVCAFGLEFVFIFRRGFEVIALSRQFDINHATNVMSSTEQGGGILAVLGNTTWTFHRRYEQISVGVIAHVDVQTMDARLLTGGLSLMEHSCALSFL